MPFWNDIFGGAEQAVAAVVTDSNTQQGTITISNSQADMNQFVQQVAFSNQQAFGNLRYQTVISDPLAGPVNFDSIPIQSQAWHVQEYSPRPRDIFTVVEEMVTAWFENGLVIDQFVVSSATYSQLEREYGPRMLAYPVAQFTSEGLAVIQEPSKDLFIHTPYGSVKIVKAGMEKINWDKYMEETETNLP